VSLSDQLFNFLFWCSSCRANGGEIHNIAALMGGIGGQEAVKLITHQYVALDNTDVYDGIRGKTKTFKF
jgi:amyloid beta precursor protein binding protein 1